MENDDIFAKIKFLLFSWVPPSKIFFRLFPFSPFQSGRKLILDGGTQLNNKNLIFAKIWLFSIFYSIKSAKDEGT